MYYSGAESTPSVMTIASAAGGGDISHILKANNTRVEKFLKKNCEPTSALFHTSNLLPVDQEFSNSATRRTKSIRPEGPKANPKGHQLEVGVWKAPRLLVYG